MVGEHALIEAAEVAVAAIAGARTVAVAERVDDLQVAVQIAIADQTHVVRPDRLRHRRV